MTGEIVIRRSDLFPVGTTVRVYALAHPEAAIPLSGVPVGAVVTEAAVAGTGSLTFTALPENVYYVAYAVVGGLDTYLRFHIEETLVEEEEEADAGGLAAVSAKVIGTDPTTKAPAVGGGTVPLLSSVVSRSAGDALTSGFDNFTGKGTAALGAADSGQAYALIDNGAAGAGLSIIAGLATNTSVIAGAAAGYAQLPSVGKPVVRMTADIAFSPASYAFTAKTAKSATLTEVSSFTGLAVGMGISGAGIPAATTITELKPGTKELVMSAEATVEAAGVAITATPTTGANATLVSWNKSLELPVNSNTDFHIIIQPNGWQWEIRRKEGTESIYLHNPGGPNAWAPGFVWPTYPETAHVECYVGNGWGAIFGPDGVVYTVVDSRLGEYPGYYPQFEVFQGIVR